MGRTSAISGDPTTAVAKGRSSLKVWDLKRVTATCRTVTPTFLKEASPSVSALLAGNGVPSISANASALVASHAKRRADAPDERTGARARQVRLSPLVRLDIRRNLSPATRSCVASNFFAEGSPAFE